MIKPCQSILSAAISTLVFAVGAGAATYHVAESGSQTPPYDTWGTAATNIHVAVALAGDTDTVLVSNGVFATTNTLVVDAGFTLESVNGPQFTTVQRDAAYGDFRVLTVSNAGALVAGFTISNGAGDTSLATTEDAWGMDVRGGVVSNVVVTLNNYLRDVPVVRVENATLTSSVVSNNFRGEVRLYANAVVTDTVITRNDGHNHLSRGVPVRLAHSSALMDRCRVVNNVQGSNARYSHGVGVRLESGTLRNTIVSGNAYTDSSAGYQQHAGGVYMMSGTMENCTVAHNTNHINNAYGRGVSQTGGTIRNCIIYGNDGSLTQGDLTTSGGTIIYSCCPDLSDGVNGNITGEPHFADKDYRLAVNSPCRDSGTNVAAVTTDIAGATRPQVGGTGGGLFHDMGAWEMNGSSGPFEVGFTGDAPLSGLNSLTVTFRPNAVGLNTNVTWFGWDFDSDGTSETNGVGLPDVSHTFGPGRYTVVLRATNGLGQAAASTNADYVSVVNADLYVATGGTDTFPFDTWAKAATDIHSAMDAAVGGCTVHVGSGTFLTTDQISLDADIDLRGSGPDVTALQYSSGNGVLKLADPDALVSGLTVRNGSDGIASGVYITGGVASNVTVTACGAPRSVYIENGLMTVSVVSNNTHGVQVAANGRLTESLITHVNQDTQGDSAPVYLSSASAVVDRCRVTDNSSPSGRGRYMFAFGVRLVNGTLRNTLVARNINNDASGSSNGGKSPGGVYVTGGTMENCTIAANTNYIGSTGGKGVWQAGGTIRNCIIYGNGGSLTAGDYTTTGGTIIHSLAPELTTGAPSNNLNGDPIFDDADYHLAVGSPCVNTGTNQAWMAGAVDLDGGARIQQSVVDMGPYEQDPSALPFTIGFYGDDPRSGLSPLDVVFHATASGPVTWYGWDFDNDGGYEQSGAGLATVTNTFAPGLYTVVLRATNDVGVTDVVTNADYVSVVNPDIYVATNGAHTFPFDTWGRAATNVNDAVNAAVGGCAVHVGSGTFLTTEQLILDADIELLGSGRDGTVLQYSSGSGVLKLGHAAAFATALTVKNGSDGLASGVHITGGVASNVLVTGCETPFAVSIENGTMASSVVSNNSYGVSVGANGTLEECVIAGNPQRAGGGGNGPVALVSASALVDRCLVTDNYGIGGHGRYLQAFGVRLVSGTLRNTLVARNYNADASGNNNGGLSPGGVSMEGGTMENCTITANTNYVASTGGKGVKQTGGTIRNCIIYDNGGSTVAGDYTTTGGTIAYSLAPELIPGAPDNNLNGDPLFLDAAQGDYHLDRGSPCINAGETLPGMSDINDLGGGPRVIQKVVDMGAYEAVPPAGTMFLLR